MLREDARDTGGHWVEDPLGCEVEEGHCWICLSEGLLVTIQEWLRGENWGCEVKVKGWIWVSFLRKCVKDQGLTAYQGWEKEKGVQRKP